MVSSKSKVFTLVFLLMLIPVLVACGGNDADTQPGLTDEQVREILRSELAAAGSTDVEEAIRTALAEMPTPEPGISRDQVENAIQTALSDVPEAGMSQDQVNSAIQTALSDMSEPGITETEVSALIRRAVADLPQPEAGLTADEARRLAQYTVATIPPKSSPPEYTKFFVDNAITRYMAEGLDATVAYYNQTDSIDGQWYVFILDEAGEVISHFDAHLLGENLNGPLGTDADGYNFGPDMLAASEDGRWVSYVYRNPEIDDADADHLGAVELKHAWVVKHERILFGSGWYTSADEYTKRFVRNAIDRYHNQGLEATLAHYNSAGSIFRQWYAFVADNHGKIIAHYDEGMLGSTLEELLNTDRVEPNEDGIWVRVEDVNPTTGVPATKHAWLIRHDGMIFGSGWFHGEDPGN